MLPIITSENTNLHKDTYTAIHNSMYMYLGNSPIGLKALTRIALVILDLNVHRGRQ